MGAETSARTLPHFRRQPRLPRPDVPVADGQSERPALGAPARMPVLVGSAIGALAEPPPTRRAVPDSRMTRIATECSFGRAVGDHPGQRIGAHSGYFMVLAATLIALRIPAGAGHRVRRRLTGG